MSANPQLDPFALALLQLLRDAAEASSTEGLTAERAAAFVGVSVSKFYAMNLSGQIPAAVELGDRCPRWLRSELLLWLRHGAPSRARWALMRDALLRKVG